MAKAKSYLEFGELFTAQEVRRVLTVAELTGKVRSLLEAHVGRVWVAGEVSNWRQQLSGHAYFTLKDAQAQLNCVLFRGEASAARMALSDGQKVAVLGDLTVYEVRGQYQLVVREVELQGAGALQRAFEKLKEKLRDEGLFDSARKRAIPAYPLLIGLVTSPTGAAIRDVLHVIRRRHPGMQMVLAGCRVQGEGAAAEIASAIRRLNDWSREGCPGEGTIGLPNRVDVILVTRGGGSLEDLWAFNEELVARAIHASEIPVISAVGHEIDFTISDFAADLRAATPSAAAEILTHGYVVSRPFVDSSQAKLAELVWRSIEERRDAWFNVFERLQRQHPRRRIEVCLQWRDDLFERLMRSGRRGVEHAARGGTDALRRWWRLNPAGLCRDHRAKVEVLTNRMASEASSLFNRKLQAHASMDAQLALLSPQEVLRRGYSITVERSTGRILRRAHEVMKQDLLVTRLAEGEIVSRVEQVTKES